MITVPAHRVKQFGVEFFQASFSAKDIERLVKFEVLGYAGAEAPAENHGQPVKERGECPGAQGRQEALASGHA